jgi:hypothetical protein
MPQPKLYERRAIFGVMSKKKITAGILRRQEAWRPWTSKTFMTLGHLGVNDLLFNVTE